MHVLIPIAVTVAIICAFFVFYAYDNLIAKNIECLKTGSRYTCSLKEVGASFVIGVLIIGFLIVLMLGVLYIVAKFLTSPEAAGGAPVSTPYTQ